MKMGRRLRCSSVTYRSRYAPLLAPCRRPILIATKATVFMGQHTSIERKYVFIFGRGLSDAGSEQLRLDLYQPGLLTRLSRPDNR